MRRFALAGAFLLICTSTAAAGDRFALVISGASGGSPYAETYDQWRNSLVAMLRERFQYEPDHVVVMADHASDRVALATRENVQRSLADFRNRLTKDDALLIVLFGHGTLPDDGDAKFNLVGPDLRASEWSELLKTMPGRLVFVDTTSSSFGFLGKLAGPNRMVLTATDAASQQYETMFPEFFLKAFDDPAADRDKNNRVSLWEAFTYAAAEVGKWYVERGQLPTERAALDDNGERVDAPEADDAGKGELARATYLDADVPAALAGNEAVVALVKRRTALETEVEQLKGRKATMRPEDYDEQLERLLLDLARVTRELRGKP